MKAIFEAPLLAIGAVLLSGVIDLVAHQPPAEGMMGVIGQDKPIGGEMSVTGEIGLAGCKEPANYYVIASNTFDMTDHGALDGYFAVGKAFDGMLRPQDPRFHWLQQFKGKPVDVIIRVREPKTLERIKQ